MSDVDALLQGNEWYASAKAAMAEGNLQEAYNVASAAQGPGALIVAADVLLAGGEAAGAVTTAQQAASLAAESGSKKMEGAALKMLAKSAFAGGLKDEGTKAAIKAIAVYQVAKDKGGEASVLALVATAHLDAGDIKEARKVSDEAANLARKANDDTVTASTNACVAAVTLALMKTKGAAEAELGPKALEAAQAAASAYRRMDQKSDLAKILQDLSTLYLNMGNVNMGLAKAKECQRIYQVLQNPEGEAKAMILVAKALNAEGSTEAATNTAYDAGEVFRSLGDEKGCKEATDLVSAIEAKTIEDKKSFTQRITKKVMEAEGTDDAPSKPYFFMPRKSMEEIKVPYQHAFFKGFMARAATVAAPKGSAAVERNKNVIYNISWNP